MEDVLLKPDELQKHSLRTIHYPYPQRHTVQIYAKICCFFSLIDYDCLCDLIGYKY